MLAQLKLILGITDDTKDSVLNLLLDYATTEFAQYCHISEVPLSAQNIIVGMASIKYNLLGSEGLGSQSYSGLAETYDHYPPELIKAMNRYRRVVAL